MGVVRFLRDGMSGLVNRMTGAGTSRDPLSHNQLVYQRLPPSVLEAAYRGNWIASKIVRIPVDDMLRQGWSWQAEDDIITKLEAEEKRLNFRIHLRNALVRDAVYGGSALYIGTTDGDTSQPLRVERMGFQSIKYLTPFHSQDLTVVEFSRDPEALGQPTMFRITLGDDQREMLIHPSRLLTFRSRPFDRPLGTATTEDFWGDSRLANVLSDITGASSALTGAARLMGELAVWKFKVKGMADTISMVGGEEQVQKLLNLIMMLKSTMNAVAIDSEDEADIVTASLTGVSDAIRQFMQNVAGAADIPYTRFMSASPDGMNATGAADLRNYYDRLVGERTNYVEPPITQFDEVFIRSALGHYDDKIYRKWNPMWQLDEQQQANLDKLKMDMLGAMLDKGTVHDHVIDSVARTIMIESPSFPGAEKAFDEAAKMTDPREAEREAAAAQANALVENGGTSPAANETKKPNLRVVKDMEPKPLYVRRDVVNAAEILAHFERQGVKNLMPKSELHVTILYSKVPVDWMKMGSTWAGDENGNLTIPPGGPRHISLFGGDAVVQEFVSHDLTWRHEGMIENGASSDHPEYRAHITISYDPGVDIESIEPWRGRILLGPEIFEEIDEDWKAKVLAKDGNTLLEDKGFNESKVKRYPAGSGKGGQFAPKGTGGGGGVKHGYAAKYNQANKAFKAAQEEYKAVFAKSDATADEKTAAAKKLVTAQAEKKQALKDYYANKGSKAAAKQDEPTPEKPKGLSVAEREAGIAKVKKQKAAALKEYKAHPTGSDEKKAALAEYNKKAAEQKKMEEGLEKYKAQLSGAVEQVNAAQPAAKAVDKPTAQPASVEKDLSNFAGMSKKEKSDVVNSAHEAYTLAKKSAANDPSSDNKAKLKAAEDHYEMVQELMSTPPSHHAKILEKYNVQAPAALSASATNAKHDAAMDAVVKKHPHPTFGKKEAEEVIKQGLAGKMLGPNQAKLFETYQKEMGITPKPAEAYAAKVKSPSHAPVVKLDIETQFKDLESKADVKAAMDNYIKAVNSGSYYTKQEAHKAYVKVMADQLGAELVPHTAQQSKFASFKSEMDMWEKDAFTAYTGSSYGKINSTLRNDKKPHPAIKEYIQRMDSGFKKTSADKDIVVQRGLAMEAVEKYISSGNFKVGATMIDKGYVSTTSKYETAQSFSNGGYHMVIRVKKGQTIAPAKSFSKYAQENEFILPRNTAFQIQHIDKTAKIVVVDVL